MIAADRSRICWDFCRRIDLQKANKRVLEALIRAGALDELGKDDPAGDSGASSAKAGGRHRATLMNQLPLALKLAEQQHEQEAAGQADLFGALDAEPSGAGAGPADRRPALARLGQEGTPAG